MLEIPINLRRQKWFLHGVLRFLSKSRPFYFRLIRDSLKFNEDLPTSARGAGEKKIGWTTSLFDVALFKTTGHLSGWFRSCSQPKSNNRQTSRVCMQYSDCSSSVFRRDTARCSPSSESCESVYSLETFSTARNANVNANANATFWASPPVTSWISLAGEIALRFNVEIWKIVFLCYVARIQE